MNDFSFEQYIKIASEFKLGELTTESFHPKTKNLSFDSKNNLPLAIAALKEVDMDALNILKTKTNDLYALHKQCQETINSNGKIFLCGCGATGRLSLAIETFARMEGKENVVGFMAGGDFALIKSVESFEDRMSYGSRQLLELGFGENDLLLAITEGGETSFVIGAVMEATVVSKRSPFFLYCNPDKELIHLERCAKVLNDKKIQKINLTVGPMALSGSTRMQATTIQMLAAGSAILFDKMDKEDFINETYSLIEALKEIDYECIEQFVVKESNIYKENGFVTYISEEQLAISLLTDTTERSPTFSLLPFETKNSKEHSLCYLTIDSTNNSEAAWTKLLKRKPRALEWGSLEGVVDLNSIYSYDISSESITRRSKLNNHHIFRINRHKDGLHFQLGQLSRTILTPKTNILAYQLSLKLILNTMSTLIMGRMERFESNMMTWVRPSNYKLIDRASRYVVELLKRDGVLKSYNEVSQAVIELSKYSDSKRPIVLRVYEHLKES